MAETGMERLKKAISERGKTRSVSEDEIQFGYNPVDELRNTVNARAFTPEQQAENRRAAAWEALSMIPGPGNVIAAYDAYTGAGDAAEAFGESDYKGGAIDTVLAGLSGLGAVVGLPVGKLAKGAADAGKDTLHIFAGPVAKTADRSALKRARKMLNNGADRVKIWEETGWFQGADKQWRFEIPDDKFRLRDMRPYVDPAMSQAFQKHMQAYLPPNWQPPGGSRFSSFTHPELRRAYKIDEEISGVFGDPKVIGAMDRGGEYYRPYGYATGTDPANLQYKKKGFIKVSAQDKDEAESTLLHELQHGVQRRERFATGGNPLLFTPEEVKAEQKRIFLEWLNSPSVKENSYPGFHENPVRYNAKTRKFEPATPETFTSADDAAYGLYQRLAGEAEARNVQERHRYSPQQRKQIPPWVSQRIPEDELIIRFDP